MKTNLLKHIILYVIVVCIGLIIATLARILVMAMGFDNFITFMVFIVVLAIQVVVYLSIHVVLQNLMLPWIGNGLAKIPYFRKKIEQRQVSIIKEIAVIGTEEETGEVITTEEKEQKEEIDEIPDVSGQPSLKSIRKEQLQIKIKEQEEKRNIALDYSRKSFALYLSDKDLDIFCNNVRIYTDKLDVAKLQTVKIKELTAVDLRHFGWNIWNYFKPREQIEIANFSKTVFPDIFRETEVKSIKRHLKDDKLKGVIKIQEKPLL